MTDKEADDVLTKLGKTPAPVPREGVRTAVQFFRRYMPHMDATQQQSYMKAMDLSKPVEIIDLLKGEQVAAFRYQASDFGEFHIRVGSNPSQLGILLGGRQFRRYEVIQRVAVLSSHTSAFMHMARGSGGALQLIIPNAVGVLRVTQRGTQAL